jgi:hypothetical protein
MNILTLKKPSAWIPVAMPLIVFAVMLVSIAVSGPPVRQADEGTGAHLFQIWLVLEVLSVAVFAVKWLPKKPKQALIILTLQVAVALLPMSVVFYLKL